MKKVVPILVIVGLVLGGLFVISRFTKPTDTTQTQEQTKTEDESLSGSIVDFLGKGKNVKCTWDSQDLDKGKGVIYISGKKFYSDTEMRNPETKKTLNTFVMSDGQWFYMWSSNSKDGTKMNLVKMQKQTEGMEAEENNAEPEKIDYSKISKDLMADYNYNCTAWVNFGGIFTLPKDIQFKDMTVDLEKLQETSKQIKEKAEEMKEGVEDFKKSACDFCVNLPEEAKAECLKTCE